MQIKLLWPFCGECVQGEVSAGRARIVAKMHQISDFSSVKRRKLFAGALSGSCMFALVLQIRTGLPGPPRPGRLHAESLGPASAGRPAAPGAAGRRFDSQTPSIARTVYAMVGARMLLGSRPERPSGQTGQGRGNARQHDARPGQAKRGRAKKGLTPPPVGVPTALRPA